ncbi:unnamed protein product [Phytophthora lilii]|uniref:Unnamed protein product n=1 Tax=Phytophthora lilii TaxID=2077276 RepID=A0A9W6X618_9STRA|nr:unnamed protein product [Phytophthora lilii]
MNPQGKAEVTSDAYGRHKHVRSAFYSKEKRKSKTTAKKHRRRQGQTRIETQNLRGFVRKEEWLGAWRRTPRQERPIVWFVQETHVSGPEEAEELESQWKRMWGKQYQREGPQLPYWSEDASKTGGVEILLNPEIADKAKPWQPQAWTNRVIAMDVNDTIFVNVYAPTSQAQREEFISTLLKWPWNDKEVIVAGDFNCVQSPALDRLGGRRSGRPESAALKRLVLQLQLEDARILMDTAEDEEEEPDPIDFYTYWGSEAASSVDRSYVPSSWTARVEQVTVEGPVVPSDHQRVRLHLREPEPEKKKKTGKKTPTYLIKTAQPKRVEEELL